MIRIIIFSIIVLVLAGCSETYINPILIDRDIPNELVRPCFDEPLLPESIADDKVKALWISNAIDAGAQCRQMHKALSKWVITLPVLNQDK